MAKFKVGDRVKYVGKDREFYHPEHIGKYGRVTDVNERGHPDVAFDDGTKQRGCLVNNVELASSEFRAGDKVRFTADNPNGGEQFGKKGDVTTITRTDVCSYTGYGKQVEVNNKSYGFGVYVPVSVLELAPTSLTIEAGRYYKTRDGRKVGPMVRNVSLGGHSYWRARSEVGGYMPYWCRDGRFYDNESEFFLDLVAEWQEPATNDNAPKFKVGDRVAWNLSKTRYQNATITSQDTIYDFVISQDGKETYANASELRLVAPATSGKPTFKVGDLVMDVSDSGPNKSKPATVTKVSGDKIAVTWPDGSGGSLWPVSDFALATSPAIVCLIENGQPKPSDFPHVHPSKDAAAKEASRLAGKHKGKQFGVYEMVSTVQQPAPVYEHEWQRLASEGKDGRAALTLSHHAGLPVSAAHDAVMAWIRKQGLSHRWSKIAA